MLALASYGVREDGCSTSYIVARLIDFKGEQGMHLK